MKNRNYLKEEFEREMWLYIEGSLNKDRINFWDLKLKENSELKDILESNLDLLETAYQSPVKLSLSEFDDLVEKASDSSFLQNILIYFRETFTNKEKHLPKLAFGITLIIAAVMFSIISDKPHPIKEVPGDILSWNPSGITQKISNVENYFYSIKLEEQKEAEIQKLTNEEWQNNYYNVESDLELIKNDLKENEL